MRPHLHDETCADMEPPCSREVDLDGRTVTGLHRLVKLHKELKAQGRKPRKTDRSLLWWVGYHLAKALAQLLLALGVLAIAAWAKHCGIKLPELP